MNWDLPDCLLSKTSIYRALTMGKALWKVVFCCFLSKTCHLGKWAKLYLLRRLRADFIHTETGFPILLLRKQYNSMERNWALNRKKLFKFSTCIFLFSFILLKAFCMQAFVLLYYIMNMQIYLLYLYLFTVIFNIMRHSTGCYAQLRRQKKYFLFHLIN